MIDFKKKLSNRGTEKKINPIEIYDTLDRKSIAGPLRSAQYNILKTWFDERQDAKDLIVKLHTGEGKTLIGLLMLQSKINITKEPCIYVCPNIYLVNQVCNEAEKFGIPYCTIGKDNILPDDFTCGEKILITHAQKIFNGKSIFGIHNNSVNVGTIVLDDSHACIDVVKQSLTITINKSSNTPLYDKIFDIFKDELAEQGEGSLIDIANGEYETFMLVPYWSWFEKQVEVLKVLSAHSKENDVQFVWQLLRDSLNQYSCYISGSKIEISPCSANISPFGVFSKANHRILMSATTQDDSFFIKGLLFSKAAVVSPLANIEQKWSGEKMLLIPSLIDENNDRDLVVSKFASMTYTRFGAVALVPSSKRGAHYEMLGATITNTDNIFSSIQRLKNKQLDKMMVINNRYDGIDLPDESCRILILDSIPYFNSLSLKYEEQCRPNSIIIQKLLAQKIEQGLGRGVRGEKDYCAILIIGSDLVKFMRSSVTNKYFSPQTRKQINIGLELAKMATEEKDDSQSTLQPTISLIKQMLERDEGWKEFYSTEMDSICNDSDVKDIYDNLCEEAKIEQLFSSLEYEQACEHLQTYIDKMNFDSDEKGWYVQQLARYTYFVSREKSVELQQSAFKLNFQLLKPRMGIEYRKISYINENRMNNIKQYIQTFAQYTELKLEVDNMLNDLSFSISAEKFESALQKLGMLLGFISQRPDKEIRKGPDNLWCCSNNHYLLFECKSEVDSSRDEISKKESGQMNNHCAWFESEYGASQNVDHFLIIPTKNLSYHGDFTHNVRIIRAGKLKSLKKQVKDFVKEIRKYDLQNISTERLQKLLGIYSLNSTDFANVYSEPYYHKQK